MDHEVLVKIVENHLRNGSISKDQKREIYDLVKQYVRDNKINKSHFNIAKFGVTKELTISFNVLSTDVLIDILRISGYEV